MFLLEMFEELFYCCLNDRYFFFFDDRVIDMKKVLFENFEVDYLWLKVVWV